MKNSRPLGWGTAVVVSSVIALGLAACSGESATPDPGSSDDGLSQTSLKVGAQPSLGNLPVYVGVKEGIFASHGLDVELVDGSDAAAMVTAVGKQIDTANTSPAFYLPAAAAGAKNTWLNNVTSPSHDKPNFMLGSSFVIDSYADLEGKRIGVPQLTGTSTGSLIFMLQHEGLGPEDYQLIQIPQPQMLDNLRAGNVDAVLVIPPFSNAIKDAGFNLTDDRDVAVDAASIASGGSLDSVSSFGHIASTEWVEAHRDVALAWRAALAESIEWILANPDDAKVILGEVSGMDPAVLETLQFPNYTMDISLEMMEAIWDVAVATGNAEGDFPADNVVLFEE